MPLATSWPATIASVHRSADGSCSRTVAAALVAGRLVELRDRWLNPPEWVEWVDEPVPAGREARVPVHVSGIPQELQHPPHLLVAQRVEWMLRGAGWQRKQENDAEGKTDSRLVHGGSFYSRRR